MIFRHIPNPDMILDLLSLGSTKSKITTAVGHEGDITTG